ncbi:MAG TPA: TonB-dependent receptor [Cellvibrio sp.]|nr:TonB-dependent receptor [Cellvibrio sp.]
MRVIRIPTTPLMLVSAFWASGLYAQTSAPFSSGDFYHLSLAELGQVEISIATGNSTPLDRAPATATVISASEIQAMGARNLNEVLETVPGLHVSLSSLSRLDSVYSIRGIHTGLNPQVLLMLNGVPVQYNAQGGRPTLFRLPVTSIDRVEVIRGPGSAVYGADAYAGVINVITKDAGAIDATRMGGGVGSFNTRDLWLQTASEWNDIGIALSVAYQESDGDDQRRVSTDLQSALDAALGTDVSLAPGALSTRYNLLDTHLALTSERVQFNLWNWYSRDAGVGAGAAQALDPAGRDDSNLWLGDLTYRFNSDTSVWDNSIRTSYFHYDQESQFVLLPPGTELLIGNDGNIDFQNPVGLVKFTDGYLGRPGGLAKDAQLDLVSIYNGWDLHRLRLAVGSRYQSIAPREQKNFGPGVIEGTESVVDGALTDVSHTPNVFLPDSSRTIRYLSIQDEWQLARALQFTAGIRHDDYSDFGTTTNPRMALVWTASNELTTKLLFASAFRAPSFTEQFSKNNPVSLGNPDLQPEQIDTAELSFAYSFAPDLIANLTLFEYRAKDMIEFIQDENSTTKTADNARDQDGRGFELELNWKPSSALYFSSSYSQQDARDAYTDSLIPDAPGQQLKANINWEFSPRWFVHGQLNWVGDRQRAATDLRADISDYTLVNVTLRRKKITPNLDVSLALRNLTDEDAREPSSGEIADDYPLESRSVWLELRYNFN